MSNVYRETPLHAVCTFPNIFAKQLLEQAGANPNAKNDEGVDAQQLWDKAM